MKKPSRIVFVANLWTLAGHPTPPREWSLERKIQAVLKAGFDAVTTATDVTEELPPLLRHTGLRHTGFFASSRPRDFSRLIRVQKAAGAENLNVQLGKKRVAVSRAAAWSVALMRAAERQGIYAAIEVHRGTAFETPEDVRAIAAAYRRATGKLLPLTWDHSHPAVVKHLKPALFAPVLLKERGLIQAARLMHCRPFNGQHAQVPVMDARGRLTPEFRTWLGFVEELFRCWLAGPQPGGELWICPEIGPIGVHGYNLSTMPPSWEQAVLCRRELAKLWRRLGGVSAQSK
ncbi:MAG: hypothetical protein QM760_10900 [Nibricoccus sp.]